MVVVDLDKQKKDLLGLCIISTGLSFFIYFTIGQNCVKNKLDAYFFYIMFFLPYIMPIYEGFFKKNNEVDV